MGTAIFRSMAKRSEKTRYMSDNTVNSALRALGYDTKERIGYLARAVVCGARYGDAAGLRQHQGRDRAAWIRMHCLTCTGPLARTFHFGLRVLPLGNEFWENSANPRLAISAATRS